MIDLRQHIHNNITIKYLDMYNSANPPVPDNIVSEHSSIQDRM